MDPCELRQKSGDTAVLDLVARRIPLVEFVLRATVGRFDLDTAEGRSAALDRGVPLVAQIKDHGLRDEYARRLGGLVGIDDPLRVVQRVRGMVRAGHRTAAPAAEPSPTARRWTRRSWRSSARRSRSRCSCPRSRVRSSTRSSRTRSCCRAHRSAARRDRGGGRHRRCGDRPGAGRRRSRQHLDESLRSGVHALAVEPLHLGHRRAGALRRRGARPHARDRRVAAGRRPQVEAAAGQPAGATRGARAPVRRADRAGELPPRAARAGDRRRADEAVPPPRRAAGRRARAAAAATSGSCRGPTSPAAGSCSPRLPGCGGRADDGPRLIGWQHVTRRCGATAVLSVIEAEVVDDLLLVDRPAVVAQLAVPRDLPPTVAQAGRGERRALPGAPCRPAAAARFVARRIPGADGVQLVGAARGRHAGHRRRSARRSARGSAACAPSRRRRARAS